MYLSNDTNMYLQYNIFYVFLGEEIYSLSRNLKNINVMYHKEIS